MASIFHSSPLKRPKKSAFKLGFTNVYTTNQGRIQPNLIEELVPGDVVRNKSALEVVFSPMISPSMGEMMLYQYFFFVPTRIINPTWEKFIVGYYQNPSQGTNFLSQDNLTFSINKVTSGSSDRVTPLFDSNLSKRYSLLDYLGYRTVDKVGLYNRKCVLAPLLAFWKIYFEYFVNENIGVTFPSYIYKEAQQFTIIDDNGNPASVDKLYSYDDFLKLVIDSVGNTLGKALESGGNIEFDNNVPNLIFLFTCPNRMWTKDYFTSALPWTQKGDPVTIPLFENDQIVIDDRNVEFHGPANSGQSADVTFNNPNGDVGELYATNNTSRPITGLVKGQTIDLQEANALTINTLRTSIKMQEWLERNARGGTRYIEQIRAHFGVRSSDARLQRPEYLGGASIPINCQTVFQTSASEDGSTPQGNMAGRSHTISTTPSFKYFAEEHGYIIGLSFIVPKPVYSQGINRSLLRTKFYDYYWPEFAHLGEQPIYRAELYNDNTNYENEVFGYQSRYAEYKNHRNEVHGDFLHDSLASWIFGYRKFSTPPKLTGQFLEVNPVREESLNAMFPVVDSDSFDKIYIQVYHNLRALRPMPKYGTPLL